MRDIGCYKHFRLIIIRNCLPSNINTGILHYRGQDKQNSQANNCKRTECVISVRYKVANTVFLFRYDESKSQ